MKITVWQRFNLDKNEWRHNHIENGHLNQSKPTGDCNQTKNWARGIWRHEHSYLVNCVVSDVQEGR